MKHIDITFDLETAALCPTAAPLSIGAVAWDRNGTGTPFIEDIPDFFLGIDLTSCFCEELTIDACTQSWWAKQSKEAKDALVNCKKSPIKAAIKSFFDWIGTVIETTGAESVCLWSQGSDFDIAILRNICYVLDIDIPIRYTNFRDHRSVFLELAARRLKDTDGSCWPAKAPCKAYDLVERYKDGEGVDHTPVFDCKKSIYSTWQMMNMVL